MPVDFFTLVAGAIGGVVSGGALRWWQYRRDLWLGRVERLCEAIDKASDSATSYWLTEPIRDADHVCKKMEAGLVGHQIKFDGLLVSVQSRWCKDDREKLIELSNQFSDGLTGGDFGSRYNRIDNDRARSVQRDASDLIVRIRQASDKCLTLRGTFFHFHNKIDSLLKKILRRPYSDIDY